MVIKGMAGLTPGIIMGLYNNRIYYGVNNTYRIFVTDMTGKALLIFSLKRKQDKIPPGRKEKTLPPAPQSRRAHEL